MTRGHTSRTTGSPAPAQPTPNRLIHSHHHIPAPNSFGGCRLSRRPRQPPNPQSPTHAETLNLPEAILNLGGDPLLNHRSQKQNTRKETEVKKQNIHPPKTNTEIHTWTYNHLKLRCLDDNVIATSDIVPLRAIWHHQSPGTLLQQTLLVRQYGTTRAQKPYYSKP